MISLFCLLKLRGHGSLFHIQDGVSFLLVSNDVTTKRGGSCPAPVGISLSTDNFAALLPVFVCRQLLPDGLSATLRISR